MSLRGSDKVARMSYNDSNLASLTEEDKENMMQEQGNSFALLHIKIELLKIGKHIFQGVLNFKLKIFSGIFSSGASLRAPRSNFYF